MVIAIADNATLSDTYVGNNLGNPQFNVLLRVTAADGTYEETNTGLTVVIPKTATTREFNDAIVDAIETWVNNQHSWSIDKKNIYFRPYSNGS